MGRDRSAVRGEEVPSPILHVHLSRRPLMHPPNTRRWLVFSTMLLIWACGDGPVASVPDTTSPVRSSGSVSARAEGGEVPIKGRLEGTTTTIRLSDTPLRYRLENVASGVISHVGRATSIWVVPEVRFDVASRQVFVLSGPWTGTVTAANGDKLYGRYAFHDNTIPFDLLGNFEASATLTITGGTGRFAGATGTGPSVISGNVFTEGFTILLQGAIRTRHAD